MAGHDKTAGTVELLMVRRGDSAAYLMNELFSGNVPMAGDVLLVLPDERLCKEARGKLSAKGGAVTTWVVTPWGLVRELYTRLGLKAAVLDRKARQVLLARVMDGLGEGPLYHKGGPRPGMVRRVSETVEELLLENISPEALMGTVRSERAEALAQVYAAYVDALRKLGVADTSEMPRLVLDALGGGVDGPAWNAAGLYMLGEQPSTLRELYRTIIDRTPRTIVVEHISRRAPSFLPPTATARTIFQGGPSTFDVPKEGSGQRGAVICKRPILGITGQDWNDELRRTVRAAKRQMVDRGVRASSIALMMPPERKSDPWTYSVLEEYGIPYDQGSRYRVIDIPVVRGLLDIFRSAEQGFLRETLLPALSLPNYGLSDAEGRRFSQGELEQVTREAYVLGGGPDPISSWTAPIRSLAAAEDRGERLRETASRVLGPMEKLLRDVMDLWRSKRSVEGQIEGMLAVWEGLGAFELLGREEEWEPPLDGERAARLALSRLMDGLSTVRANSVLTGTGMVSLKEVLDLIVTELTSAWLEEGRGPGGIRVLSYGEGTGMSFDHLFVMGLNEGSMPPRENGFALLSEMERKQLKMPPASKRRQALEALCIALSSAEQPVMTLHRTEGGSPVLVSPFVEGIELEGLQDDGIPMSAIDLQRRFSEIDDPLSMALDASGKRQHPSLQVKDELLSRLDGVLSGHVKASSEGRTREMRLMDPSVSGVVQDPELLADLAKRFGPEHIWSASRLETLRTCPYSFFVRYVLGIQELEEVEAGVAPEKLGTIFHSAAESFYGSWKGKAPGRVHPSERDSAIAAMTGATLEVMGRYSHSGPYWDAVRERLLGDGRRPGMVQGFISSEADYRGQFRVMRTELRFGMPGDEGGLPAVRLGNKGTSDGAGSFLFRGSMDRVDAVEAGGAKAFFIWDYKTGTTDEDKKGLQVPLYLLACSRLLEGRSPAGGGYYYVRRPGAIVRDIRLGDEVWDATRLTGEALDGASLSSRSAMDEALDTALDLIATARGGSFPPKESCKDWFCPYSDICRRGER